MIKEIITGVLALGLQQEPNMAYVDVNKDGITDLYLMDTEEIFLSRPNHYVMSEGIKLNQDYLAKAKKGYYTRKDEAYNFKDISIIPLSEGKYGVLPVVHADDSLELKIFSGSGIQVIVEPDSTRGND